MAVHRTLRWISICVCLLPLLGWAAGGARAQTASDRFRQTLRPQDGVAIYDHAKLLDAGKKAELEEVCRSLRKDIRVALVVVTLPDLQGGEINDFKEKLFKQWRIGTEKQDNGVLLLIAMKERKAGVEVGYGLEGILTDGLAKRVLDQELFPRFKQQRYQEGVDAAVKRLALILDKAEPAPKEEDELTGGEKAIVILFLSLFVGVGALVFGIGLGSKYVQVLIGGLLFAGFPMVIGAVMAFPYAPILHTAIAIPAGIFGYSIGGLGTGVGKSRRRYRGGHSAPATDWNWGSLGGGSSFGGGSSSWSGGGFSSDWGGFSGGSSGGGGASGGW